MSLEGVVLHPLRAAHASGCDVGAPHRGRCDQPRCVGSIRRRIACMLLIAVCCPQLAGCAALAGLAADGIYAAAFRTTIIDPSRLSADDQEKVRTIQVLTEGDTPSRVFKGPVKGFACKLLSLDGWHWRPAPSASSGSTPELAALTQMKIKAVQLGGDAVVLKSCTQRNAWDWGNDCFDTWTCIGEAVTLR